MNVEDSSSAPNKPQSFLQPDAFASFFFFLPLPPFLSSHALSSRGFVFSPLVLFGYFWACPRWHRWDGEHSPSSHLHLLRRCECGCFSALWLHYKVHFSLSLLLLVNNVPSQLSFDSVFCVFTACFFRSHYTILYHWMCTESETHWEIKICLRSLLWFNYLWYY